MATRRSALGRGLEALIPGGPTEDARPDSSEPSSAASARSPRSEAGIRDLPIDAIVPNPDQPRRRFDPEELEKLAASLRRHGVLQPVVVRAAQDHYELVVGERRWRAARLAGLERIPVTVADIASPDRLEFALVENVQRRDLNPVELAQAFSALSDAGLTHQEIGERVGMDRSSVSNYIRLLELPRDLQQDLEENRIQLGHAKALLSVAQPERRRGLRDRIVRDGLSVRQTEAAARALPGTRTPRGHPSRAALDPDLQTLIAELRSVLKTQVRLRGTPSRGRIEIEYHGGGELQRIAAAILEPE
jgi:ParB family chromosome partitioning protein